MEKLIVVMGDGGDFPERDGDGFHETNMCCEPLKRRGVQQQEGEASRWVGPGGRAWRTAKIQASCLGNGDFRQEAEVLGMLGNLFPSRYNEGKG